MWAQGKQWNPMSMDAAAYQNMSHESVDWASLAQQWIQMKEVNENGVAPLTLQQAYHEPAKSSLSDVGSGVIGGEAEMDVEKDDEASDATVQDWSVQSQSYPNSWPQQPNSQAPIRLGLHHIHHPNVHSAHGLPVIPGFHQNLIHQPTSSLTIPPGFSQSFRVISPAVNSSFPRVPMITVPPKQGSSDEDSLGATPSFGAFPSLDATKRKNLPAWIREGLEKMEREKQKKEEREKFLQDREIQRQKEIELSNQLSQDPNVVLRSRFDDSEDGDSEEQDDETETAPALAAPKTRETLQDVMIKIRQLMTEVLLEVTTEEIREAAVEAMLFFKVKIQQVQSSLSSKSLTRKLGLDQYESDGSVSSDDDAGGGKRKELQRASGSEDSAETNGHEKLGKQLRYSEEEAGRSSHQASQETADKKRSEKIQKSEETRQTLNEKCVKISETVGKVNHELSELAVSTGEPKMKTDSTEKKSGSELDISKSSKSSDQNSKRNRKSKSPDIRRRSRSRDRHSSNSGRSNRNRRRSKSRRSRSHSRDSKRSSKRSRSRSIERKYSESKRTSTSPYRRKSGHGKKGDSSRDRRKSRSKSRSRSRDRKR